MDSNYKLPLEINLRAMSRTQPSMAYGGGDFTAWQDTAREKLAWLLGMDKFTAVQPQLTIEHDTATAYFRDIRFRFYSEEGYSVPCHLCVPAGASAPLPLAIVLQGHSPGMYVSLGELRTERDESRIEGDRDFARRAVREGVCALALEQRCFGECGSREDGSPDCYDSAMTALLVGRTAIGERVWDIMRAIDVVSSSFSHIADTSRLICLGNSGGGTATFYAACLDKRIKIAVPSCAVCTYDESIAAIHHCACNYIPHIREYFNMGDLCGLIAPRALITVSGLKDNIFPIHGARETAEKARELYSACGAPGSFTVFEGAGGHRFYADGAWESIHKFLKGLE